MVSKYKLTLCFLAVITLFYLLQGTRNFTSADKLILDYSLEKESFVSNLFTVFSNKNDILSVEHFLNNSLNNITTLNVNNLADSAQFDRQEKKTFEQNKTRNASLLKQETGCVSWTNIYKVNNPISNANNIHSDSMLFHQNRVVKEVNCRLLFDDNITEKARAFQRMQQPLINVSPSIYLNVTKHCDKYIRETGYITSSLTEEERLFPIAYSILVYKDIKQVEMLLRSIYRPQNVYCIHCDVNADDHFRQALNSIVGCFTNVFMASKSYKVEWGRIEVLLPEITCMSDLWKYANWKYFINLTGQEFPLRTNYELVKILKAYNGSNNVEGTIKRANLDRWPSQTKPPHNITLVKGSVHIVVNRHFVDYVLHSKISEEFLEWIRTNGVDVPDETFFATLNHNPHLNIPGSYKGDPELDCEKKPFLTRFKNWGDYVYDWPCKGKRVRLICIFGIEDLPLLMTRQELFANKFHFDYQPYTYQCMDELLFNRTRDEYYNILQFDTSMYQSLEFIKNKV